MSEKTFKISGDQIQRLIPNLGAGIASDRIMVEGAQVGCMERQEPLNETDTGWGFTSGFETDEELGDPSRSGVYDVNTVANYDPEIIRFLTYPVGTRVARPAPGQPFVVEVGPDEPPPMRFLPPYPATEPTRLGGGWVLTPPVELLRRLDDGSLVLWRPGLTFYLELLGAPPGLAVEEWLAGLCARASPDRTDESIAEGPLTSLAYRLVETSPGGELAGRYGFARFEDEVLHFVGYFDDEESEGLVKACWASLSRETEE